MGALAKRVDSDGHIHKSDEFWSAKVKAGYTSAFPHWAIGILARKCTGRQIALALEIMARTYGGKPVAAGSTQQRSWCAMSARDAGNVLGLRGAHAIDHAADLLSDLARRGLIECRSEQAKIREYRITPEKWESATDADSLKKPISSAERLNESVKDTSEQEKATEQNQPVTSDLRGRGRRSEPFVLMPGRDSKPIPLEMAIASIRVREVPSPLEIVHAIESGELNIWIRSVAPPNAEISTEQNQPVTSDLRGRGRRSEYDKTSEIEQYLVGRWAPVIHSAPPKEIIAKIAANLNGAPVEGPSGSVSLAGRCELRAARITGWGIFPGLAEDVAKAYDQDRFAVTAVSNDAGRTMEVIPAYDAAAVFEFCYASWKKYGADRRATKDLFCGTLAKFTRQEVDAFRAGFEAWIHHNEQIGWQFVSAKQTLDYFLRNKQWKYPPAKKVKTIEELTELYKAEQKAGVR